MLLIGRKIKIRNFEKTDLKPFLELVKDKNNHDSSGLEYTTDEKFGADIFDLYLRREDVYAIALKDNDLMIGLIELNKRGVTQTLLATREIGFVIDKKFRHKGYAKEAVQLLIDYGFNELKLTEIWAGSREDNPISQKLLEKLKFEYIYKVNQAVPYVSQVNIVKYYLLKK
ncbi:GNAT family N-acetyltransferase [Lactobacillus halodurans]|uniref:GNAT family N-acetyltransferase n=1 Tax=Companilactobacillus halodurans TaxID=2584183 RepID=A0A5P0ZPX5_9LACO|nr:GNAT family N-acetyltransferase [Companilactobacillus halodurans]MQS76304.1 GNAT family N-acetyltransferase [Companilactobacillus halodurans]